MNEKKNKKEEGKYIDDFVICIDQGKEYLNKEEIKDISIFEKDETPIKKNKRHKGYVNKGYRRRK